LKRRKMKGRHYEKCEGGMKGNLPVPHLGGVATLTAKFRKP